MSTNGNANGHCNGGTDVLEWKVGLINCAQKYLTEEPHVETINADGTCLKKKQTWILEQDIKESGNVVVYIKSSKGRYISVDNTGKVTCAAEAKDRGTRNKFFVEYDSSGRWGFRNVDGNYLGGATDNIHCSAKTLTDTELWVVQLASHPQVNLRNIDRSRYAVLCDNEIHCKEVVPWGEAGLIILHFSDGKYSLKTIDNKFLHRDGSLVNDLENDAQFTLEMRSNPFAGLAFKDSKGYYLTAVGSTATMKAGKNKNVGKNELFNIEHSHPQVTVTSQNNKKLVSMKQGVDLSANQEEICEKSTFQMEYDKTTGKWAFRTCIDKYWSQESFGGIQAASKTVSDKSLFTVTPNEDGTYCIKAPNGNYLYNKQTGSMLCNMENPDSKNFIIQMVNRPFLVLKCEFGFVGIKSDRAQKQQSDKAQKQELVCNKTNYGVTFLESEENGFYYLKADNCKYWTVAEDGSLQASGDSPRDRFRLEFQGQCLMTIMAPSGMYLKAEQNSLRAKGEMIDNSTKFEY